MVQLGQTQAVCAVNDDRVGRGYVDSRFDDRGAQQNVITLLIEAFHDFFQLALRHLAVGYRDTRFRYQFFQACAAVVDGFDFVVQEISLSTSLEFA